MTDRKVAVVILSWNGREETLECLRSLACQTYSPDQTILVDNASSDGTVEAVSSFFEQVTILQNSENKGFSVGNNIGIHKALEDDASYILLLNNDTVFDPQMIEKLMQVITSDANIGAVGPKIYYFAEPGRLWAAGGIINYTETVGRMRGYRKLDRGQFNQVEEVDYVPGCAMLLKREALERVGLLDPIYSPGYFEDSDWCIRAKKKGYRIVYVPEAIMWHKVSLSSGGEYNPRERYLLGLHSILFIKRYANRRQVLKYLALAFGTLPAIYVLRTMKGQGRAVLYKGLGLIDGLCGYQRQPIPR